MKSYLLRFLGLAFVVCALGISPAKADKASNTLVWATDREMTVPMVWWNSTTEMAAMMHHIFDALIYRDPDTFEYKPLLAKSYKWIDSKTMELDLRTDVVFHDGSKFDADDVVATYTNLNRKDAKVLYRRFVAFIKSAEKLGSHKVRLNFGKPFPAALEFLSGTRMGIVPSEAWDRVKKDAAGKPDWSSVEPIGTGPFMIEEWVQGERSVLKRNPNYFSGPKGKASLDKIIFRTIPDSESQMAELLTGSIDWMTSIPKEKAADLKAMNRVNVINAPDLRVSFLQMDVTGRSGDTPFKKLKVRQAVAHAIDRNAIAKGLVGDASVAIHGPCFPTQFGCTSDVKKYAYDPAKAKKLLAEAGYPNGFTTDFYAYRQRPFTEATMEYLRKVGIKTNLKYLQFKALRTAIRASKTPFNHLTWASGGLNDVSAIISVYFKHSKDDYCRDDKIKEWVELADSTIDVAKRKEAYKKALTRIVDKLCWLPMYTYAKSYAYQKELNFIPTADGFPLFYRSSWK
ncbi:MAG: ABC transporter substrate-binding protein [Rhodospirillales bacterium]|nr:ABC transporter substrate-binding protein [Rhodospirillales bacterium]